MKIIFAGTPDFALPTLQALINSPHKICAVYTQPDRPSGRGKKLTQTPVKKFALDHNLPLYQPATLKDENAQKQMQDLHADALVNVAYGLLLPKAVLKATKFGCINIHPSLLPRWRGAAPIQRTIMAQDTITGVTIMQMDIGLDTGDIYKQETLHITDTDTTATLLKKTSQIGAKLLLEVLNEIEAGTAKATPQSNEQTTYASKISKEEGKIDWNKNAQEIDCMIRAFNPWPVAYTEINGDYLRIWEAKALESNQETHEPGKIIKSDKDGIMVATGNGILSLLKIQLPGGKPLPTNAILNAHQQKFAIGQKFS